MSLPPANTQQCARCGVRASNWHERLPRGRGGLRDRFNAVPLCGSGTTGCHGLITANPAWATANGWTVTGYMVRGRYIGADRRYFAYYNDDAEGEAIGGDAA